LGNPTKFKLTEPKALGLNMSFSGLKSSFQYLLRDEIRKDPDFIEKNKNDLCAVLQSTIVKILISKLEQACQIHNIKNIALAGGVSANSGLREAFEALKEKGFNSFIPPFAYCTDNAAMIAITGYFKYQAGLFSDVDASSSARYPI
jgi:N6-L-threonylcarbamoyladenine synthase